MIPWQTKLNDKAAEAIQDLFKLGDQAPSSAKKLCVRILRDHMDYYFQLDRHIQDHHQPDEWDIHVMDEDTFDRRGPDTLVYPGNPSRVPLIAEGQGDHGDRAPVIELSTERMECHLREDNLLEMVADLGNKLAETENSFILNRVRGSAEIKKGKCVQLLDSRLWLKFDAPTIIGEASVHAAYLIEKNPNAFEEDDDE